MPNLFKMANASLSLACHFLIPFLSLLCPYLKWPNKVECLHSNCDKGVCSQELVLPLSVTRMSEWSALYDSLGVHYWHLLRPDVVWQAVEVQQHHESSTSQQQHGRKNLDPWHIFPQLQEGRCPLDHHTQSDASDMEWWADTVYFKVNVLFTCELFLSYINWAYPDSKQPLKVNVNASKQTALN